MKSKVLIICLVILILFSAVGCWSGYGGKHRDLYTVATNSLLWNTGYSTQTERFCDPTIQILETDNYGRTLFSYTESALSGKVIWISALLICQKVEEKSVFYYPIDAILVSEIDAETHQNTDFSEEEIAALKARNDWGQSLSLEKCTKKEISNKKTPLPFKESQIQEYLSGQGVKVDVNCKFYCLTTDQTGLALCYGWEKENSDAKEEYFIFLLNTTASEIEHVKFLRITDPYHYQDTLRAFLADSNWDTSIL